MRAPVTTGTSRLGVHLGKILMMVANKYNSLTLTLVETVQNAIDEKASNVFIGIDYGRRQVVVFDDGQGASIEKFDAAIATVGESQKEKTQLGKFGIGVISPVNKCTRYEFVSVADGERKPNRWTFAQREIEQQVANISIPRQRLDTMPAVPKPFRAEAEELMTYWRTMVIMHGLKQDRAISDVDLDTLEEHIRFKLLRERKMRVRVMMIGADGLKVVRDIEPLVYTGEQFPVYNLESPATGRVEIALYRAPKRGNRRKGMVQISDFSEPVYPITWSEFLRQANGLGWTKENQVFEALGSGYFEGLIRCEGLELADERTKFVINEALLEFYVLLDDWFQQTGRRHYEAEQEELRDERYTRLSMQVMDEVRDLFRLQEFSGLAGTLLEKVQLGRIGGGHGEEGKKIIGDDDKPSTRTGQGGAGKPRTPDGKRTGGRGDNPTRDGDIPTGVVGSGKRIRALVKNDSIGLWIEVADLETSFRLWEFDVRTGLLQFNSRHAVWNDLDGVSVKRRGQKHDRQLMKLQKMVVMFVLSLLRSYPLEHFEEHRRMFDENLRAYVTALIAE